MSKVIWFLLATTWLTIIIVNLEVPEEILKFISGLCLGAFFASAIHDYFIGEAESSSALLLERYRRNPILFYREHGIPHYRERFEDD